MKPNPYIVFSFLREVPRSIKLETGQMGVDAGLEMRLGPTGVRNDSATKRARAFNYCQRCVSSGRTQHAEGWHTNSFISEISLSTSSIN
jgi:hypothetical protein